MAKNEKDKQTTTHMTQHRKLKNKQHEPQQSFLSKLLYLLLLTLQLFHYKNAYRHN